MVLKFFDKKFILLPSELIIVSLKDKEEFVIRLGKIEANMGKRIYNLRSERMISVVGLRNRLLLNIMS